MILLKKLFLPSTGSKLLATVVILVAVLTACESSFKTHDEQVKAEIRNVNYNDGISKQEATTIANAYLILYGKYKGRAAYARIYESDEVWTGKVYIGKSMASPVDANLPPVVIHKTSGNISWNHGPTLERIDLDELDKAEPSVAVF